MEILFHIARRRDWEAAQRIGAYRISTLGPGGFAMMPSKAMHWFTCKSKNTCLMFVTFDRTYDIVWAKQAK